MDGTSNTISVVRRVTTTPSPGRSLKIRDIGAEIEARSLLGHHPKGTNIGLLDGSVRFLKESISPKQLKALTTRNGGEYVVVRGRLEEPDDR